MARFSLMGKKLNLEQIEGKYSAFVKVPYALVVRTSKKIAKDGYGIVTVDGVEISRGETFEINYIIKMNCMLVPAGEVAREFDREYTITFSGFIAEDGSKFPTQSIKFRTLPRKQRDPNYAAHDEECLQAAREGMVLLQNDGILPLRADSELNCFGRGQYLYRNTATGAGLINPRWQADFHQAVEEHSTFKVNEDICNLYKGLHDIVPSVEQLKNAKNKSDTALIFISRSSGEFLDNRPIKGGYYLTDDEENMISAISKVFEKTVVVINSGYPISLEFMRKYKIKSAIFTGLSGMLSGYALTEILDGRTNPSGKLPDTFTYDYYDYPSAHNFPNLKEGDTVPGEGDKGVRIFYEEDIYVGYRYFDTFKKEVAYPFGHGLSYTTFEIKTDKVETKKGIDCDITVKNTGEREGKEVVELYVGLPDGKIEKPLKVLAAFEKTKSLQKGEEQTLHLHADKIDFASFDEASGSYVLEAGTYTVFIGNSVASTEAVSTFEIAKTETLKKVNRINQPVEKLHLLTKSDPTVNEDTEIVELDKRIPVPANRATFKPKELKKDRKVTFEQLKNNPKLLDEFVAQLSKKQLCKLNVSGGAEWYFSWSDGSAGKTYKVKGLPKIKASDGNTGLNLRKPNIGFPSSATIAATFNKELAENVGRVIGEESRENGILINLGPAMNIHRNILSGRHPEYFSEDPYLSGMMAGHHAKGLESAGVRSTYKHLFCNGSETSRKGSHSIVSERALREIYFRTFEIAMGVQKSSCLMTSYNLVNGIYPAENAEILQTLIRGEWNYDGMIMTDWCSYDTIDTVEMAKAGNCWITEGGRKYVKKLYKAAKSGRLPKSVLQDNVKYVIRTILKSV